MQRITIKYSISRTVALAEGRAEYGEATYQPTDTEVAFLSADDRKYLDTLDLDRRVFSLPTGTPPTWPVIADSIKAGRQAVIDKQAAELAAHEDRILECLAEPDARWFVEQTNWHNGPNCKSVALYAPVFEVRNASWGYQDPRVVARMESLNPELERRQAVIRKENERVALERETAEQRKAEALAQAAAEKQAAIDELTQWCIEHGPVHLQRAAREEYNVVGGCVQWLTEQLYVLAPGTTTCTIIRDKTKMWDRYSWDDRKSPGLKAFEVLDAMTAAVKDFPHPASVVIEVERILLVEVEPVEDDDEGSKREFTAVVVNVIHPAAARRCLVIEVPKV